MGQRHTPTMREVAAGKGAGGPNSIPCFEAHSRYSLLDRAHYRVEYQTLRRLPKSNAILFTVRSYVDPLRNVERAPMAAAAVAANLRRRYKGSFQYFSIGALLHRVGAQRVLVGNVSNAVSTGVRCWSRNQNNCMSPLLLLHRLRGFQRLSLFF